MSRKPYTPTEKAHIIVRVSEIGTADAAKEAGVSYQTVLRWV
jgi:transposase-like protein